MTMTASETSLTSSSSSSAKSNVTLPPELPSSSFPFLSPEDGVASDQDGASTVPSTPFLAAPAPINAGDGAGSRRSSSFLLGRASVAGTGLSKSDPTLNFFVEERKPPVARAVSSSDATTSAVTTSEIQPASPSVSLTPVPPSPSTRSHHHHHHRKQSSWQKKMSAMGTMLQGKIMRDKAWYVVQLSKTLEELTESMAEACDGRDGQRDGDECERREEQFIDINVRIKDEVNDIFDHIQMALRDRVSSKKLQQLKQLRAQSNPALDISVRFFGLDWNALSEQLTKLLSHAGAVSDLLNAPERRRRDNGRGGGGRKSEDARLLEEAAQLVVVMSRVQENLVLHAEAVLHGRINRQRNDIMREQQQSTNRVFLETLRKRRESLAAEKALKMSRGPLGRILQRFHMQRGSPSSPRSSSSTALSKEDVRRLRLVAAARSASSPSPRPSMGRRTGHTSFGGVGGAVIAGRRLSKRGGGAVCTDNRARSARGVNPGGGGGGEGGRGQQQRMRSKSCVPGELEGLWQHFEPAGRRFREEEEEEDDDGAEMARARVQNVRFKRQFQRLEIGQ